MFPGTATGSGFEVSDRRRHDLRLSVLRSSPFRVTIYTMSGLQCCPPGVGEETADGNSRLTCSPRLLVGSVLSMKNWIRFSTHEERRAQREAGEAETWWHPLGMQITALAFNNGIAAHELPIGYCGASVTALVGNVAKPAWARGIPVDTSLLENVVTPPTPRSVISSDS